MLHIVASFVFNIFLEVVVAKALHYVDDGITICGYTLNSLRFANDIAAVSDSQQWVETAVGSIADMSQTMGMCISTEKTKVRHIGRHLKSMTITINQQNLKQTNHLTTDDTAEQDIRRKIGLACDEMNRLATY